MKLTDFRNLGRASLGLLTLGLSLVAGGCGESHAKEALDARWVSAPEVRDLMVESLESGHRTTVARLQEVGVAAAVDDVLAVDGWQLHDLSSRALVEELYLRAEAAEAGQGRKLLASIYVDAESRFGALREDPRFAELRGWARELGSSADAGSMRFAPHAPNPGRLSPAVQNAVDQLAYVCADGNLSQVRDLAEKVFRKPGFSFDRAVAESSNARDAIARMVKAGAPPPEPARAMMELMEGLSSRSGALAADADFLRSVAKLKGELGLKSIDDPVLRGFIEYEDALPSRQNQLAQAALRKVPGKVEVPERAVNRVAQLLDDTPTAGRSSLSKALARSAQHYSDYVSVSFEAADFASTATDAVASGGGGGGGGGGSRPSYETSKPSRNYMARARSMGAETGRKVSRSFRRARFSARGARGVAAGGDVDFPSDVTPIAAAWIANEQDGRFGRLVVSAQGDGGAPRLVASRALFADSFFSALSVLSGAHRGQTAFQEGSVLVLMSMDPFAVVDEQGQSEIDRQFRALEARARTANPNNAAVVEALELEVLRIQMASAALPRRVVHHPALFGRELAWSVTRIDFSFNDVELLSQEGAMLNGGRAMPDKLRSIDLSGAATWQFFERDSRIHCVPEHGLLQVISAPTNGASENADSHFAVTVFGQEPDEETEELPRLESIERQLQGMLDWLAVNHHDYIRLGHFSESFSLLRWLHAEGVSPLILDMDGEAPMIGTPDRIVIGEGPMLPK